MKIYVLRHGQTDGNITGVMQGNMDTKLNALGKEQARKAKEILKEAGIDLVICSPKSRTAETAHLAAPDIPIFYDDRLLSRDHGEFEGLRRDQVNLQDYWDLNKNVQYEKAESVKHIVDRVTSLLMDIKKHYSDKTVLLVTHSGITRILYYYFNGFPEDGNLLGYEVHNGLIEEYEL